VPLREFVNGDYIVYLHGDFVEDSRKDPADPTGKKYLTGKGVDADNLPGWVPNRASGDQIQGGTFESWFTFKQG